MKFTLLSLLILSGFTFSAKTPDSLENTIKLFWEARNNKDFEKIFFYESKIGAITGSSSENFFFEDPPPDLQSVIDYYSLVQSDVKPTNIKIYELSEDVFLSLYYLTGIYQYSNGKINNNYQTRVSNIWLWEDEGFKLYYKNFTNLDESLAPQPIIAYPMN